MSYVNLHGHSHYSLLDGFGSPKEIVKRAKELGYPAAALTDHGVTYGLIELYEAAKEAGIIPVLGCEFYVAPRTRFDKDPKLDVKPYHLTILAENNEGYKNLLEMVSKAHLEGFYYRPRIDYGLLKAHSKGLIVLSGCLAAHLPRSILSGNEEEVHRVIKEHIDMFGKDSYFLEMQDHPLIENQQIVNARIKELAKEYGLGLVVTNDSHYPRPEDKDIHDVLLCIQTQANLSDENRMRYTGDFSIRAVEDLLKAFPDCPEAISNTVKIAERCKVEFDFDNNLIPSFATPQLEKPEVYLRMLCEEGLKVRFPDEAVIGPEYFERLNFELDIVHKMGFDTYFLIVHDFVKYAKDNGIIVGPGRGSAAGSIIAWTLRITDMDPIAHGLFFERFLNPERVSMPDIDIDFADTRRDEVLSYVINKYGRERVAQIITFGTMAPKAAVRDVGRALGYPYAEVDALSKIVPAPVLGKHMPLESSIKNDPELKREYENNERAKVLLDYARRLEGTVRHVGTHACAVIIADNPLVEYTALQYGAGGRGEIVTQYSAKPLESLGLLKMDFLGLRNLTIMEKTVNFAKSRHGVSVDINNLPMEDEKTFEVFQRGDTTGVFQFESGGMRRYLKQLKPTRFEDVVAMGALYRPGPMDWIPTYIKGKHEPESVKYLDPSFKLILESTYGVAVYQEQILQLARDFAGFSLGEADLLRKAVGKKIPSLLAEQCENFVAGAVKNGHDEKFSKKVFADVVEPFAGYGFNKAHAVCYGMIAYQTAYLKAHFPVEFMTALLCCDANNMDRVVLEIKECSEMGISVLPPSVNESVSEFTVVGEKAIRFGLLAIKGVGEGPIGEIISARDKAGPFKSLEDFARRVSAQVINKKLIQALAYSGAFDEFGDRNQIAESYEDIASFAKMVQNRESNGQIDLFGTLEDQSELSSFRLKMVEKASNLQKLKWEKEFLGIYVSGHPLKGFKRYISRKALLIETITRKRIDKQITVIGIVSEFRKMMTKSGGYMATFVVEDPTARMAAIAFSRALDNFGANLANDVVASITGKFVERRGQFQIVVDSMKVLSLDAMTSNAKEAGMFEVDDKETIAIRSLDDILAEVDFDEENPAPAGEGVVSKSAPPEAAQLPDEEAEIFNITVPAGSSAEAMTALKQILIGNQGETAVELYFVESGKKLKLPFGVTLSPELKSGVNKILES